MFIAAFSLNFLVYSGQSQAKVASKTLNEKRDLFLLMLGEIDRFLTNETARIRQSKENLWESDFSNPEASNNFISFQRDILVRLV